MTVYMLDFGFEGNINSETGEELRNQVEFWNENFYQRVFLNYSTAKDMAGEIIQGISEEIKGFDWFNGINFEVVSESLCRFVLHYEENGEYMNVYAFINVIETE